MKRDWKYMKLAAGILTGVLLLAGAFFILKPSLPDTVDSIGTTAIEAPFAELPARLLIPSIDVDAPVQLVGIATSSAGEMEVPDNFTDVGWYKHGPRPGMPGSAVIAGHLNGKDVPRAVFYDLSAVEIDDEIHIIDVTGEVLTFKVVNTRTYAYDSPTEEVFISNDGKVRLNLITCAGEWIGDEQLYNERIVVFTELVNPAE
ncbi:MAG: class F sortase [Candidatus Paceibacterota bacterium]